jgi:hypothetical protein
VPERDVLQRVANGANVLVNLKAALKCRPVVNAERAFE